MDALDRRLIDALRADGRASYAELSRIVGLSSSSVHERVAKLEASGVIQGYRAVVDPIKVGFGVTALVGIEPGETGDDEVIAAGLDAMPEVESSYSVAGNEAFIVKVRVADIDALHRCLGRLRAIRGVARTRTTVVLATRYEMRPHLLEPVLPGPSDDEPDAIDDRRAQYPELVKARSFWPLALAYVALRIVLTLVIAVVLVLLAQLAGLDMPVLVALMLAVIIQLPLAWLLLGSMRRRLTAQMAASAGERRQLRGELRAALSDTAPEQPKSATPGSAAPGSGTHDDEVTRP